MDDDSQVYDNPEEEMKAKKEELELRRAASDIAEINKKLDEKYEEKMKLLEGKPDPADESQERAVGKALAAAKEKYAYMKAMISDARKNGKDPVLAEIVLRNIPPKIKLAEVTREKNDVQVIENILKRAEQELKEALQEEKIDVKKEIEDRLQAEGISKKQETRT